MRVNSYSLFGDRQNWAGKFAVNIRQHLAMYPSWIFWIYTDRELEDVSYMPVLRELANRGIIRVSVVPSSGQFYHNRYKCLMMLWRLLPLWEGTEYVFCRDVDSILTPRQLQCVRSFISSGMIAHGINDNACHNIPLMGGMCGFRTSGFRDIFRTSFNNLADGKYGPEKWATHGADQHFMMEHIWPLVRHSAMINKLDGPNGRCHLKRVTDADISDIPQAIREQGDNFTNYIGASGTITDKMGSFSDRQIAEFYDEYGGDGCRVVSQIEKSIGWCF